MKILNGIDGFRDKVNFVDENNVCVGYDLSQDCCEDADWFISDEEQITPYIEGFDKRDKGDEFDYEGYVFEKSYMEDVLTTAIDDGGMVRFKLVNGDKIKYLHLYNIHNGWYGHGFEFLDGENVIYKDYL